MILSACTPKEELEWRSRLSERASRDGADGYEILLFRPLVLGMKPMGTVFGKPGMVYAQCFDFASDELKGLLLDGCPSTEQPQLDQNRRCARSSSKTLVLLRTSRIQHHVQVSTDHNRF